jgi:hypothetical protein
MYDDWEQILAVSQSWLEKKPAIQERNCTTRAYRERPVEALEYLSRVISTELKA